MNNEYHRDIIELLMESGKRGMKVKDIARHIYNRHCGFFAPEVVFDKIYMQVRFYLCRQVSGGRSPFWRRRWGYYAIRPDFARQLTLAPKIFRIEADSKQLRSKEEVKAVQLQLFEES
ncbi:MAG: hypothetical protein LUC86_09385 [Prevotellaceae bacterium]|nr:hypothetical protein [Prevotellaceae bacterium]